MTSLTVLCVLLLLLGVATRFGLPKAIAVSGSTPVGAAVIVSGTAVPTFYFVVAVVTAVFLFAVLIGSSTLALGSQSVGVWLLIAFAGWVAIVTLTAPFFFDGMRTEVAGVIDSHLEAGTVTTSNFAQLLYLIIGIITLIFLARYRYVVNSALFLSLSLTVALCLWAYFHLQLGVPFPEKFFDNSPSFRFIQTAPGGADRFRGIFSEPAGLAVSCIVAASFMLSFATRTTGALRVAAYVVAAVAIYLGSISTSATFVIGGISVLCVAVLSLILGFCARRSYISVAFSILMPLLATLVVWVLPTFTNFASAAIEEKVGSTSYEDRGSLDDAAFSAFFDSYGLGVGVGSNRASSFLASLMSTTGVVGVALFVAGVGWLICQGWRFPHYRPVCWALIALLIVKGISGPDLSDTSGILWIGLGALASLSVAGGGDRARGPGRPSLATSKS